MRPWPWIFSVLLLTHRSPSCTTTGHRRMPAMILQARLPTALALVLCSPPALRPPLPPPDPRPPHPSCPFPYPILAARPSTNRQLLSAFLTWSPNMSVSGPTILLPSFSTSVHMPPTLPPVCPLQYLSPSHLLSSSAPSSPLIVLLKCCPQPPHVSVSPHGALLPASSSTTLTQVTSRGLLTYTDFCANLRTMASRATLPGCRAVSRPFGAKGAILSIHTLLHPMQKTKTRTRMRMPRNCLSFNLSRLCCARVTFLWTHFQTHPLL